MTDSEDVKPLGRFAGYFAAASALVKWADKNLRIALSLAALVAVAITTCRADKKADVAATVAVVETQKVKDKSEAGKQETNHKASEQDARLLRLERLASRLNEDCLQLRAKRRSAVVEVTPVEKPMKLSATLDEALAKVQAKANNPDAAPPAAPSRNADTGVRE